MMRAAALFVTLAALMAGCGGSGNPSFETVSHQFYEAYCTRLHECMIELHGKEQGDVSFSKAYPGGETDCVDQNYKEFSSLSALESHCTQEQWDACTKELRTNTCVQSTTTPAVGVKIPDSCRGC
jgi:hypothetical protein